MRFVIRGFLGASALLMAFGVSLAAHAQTRPTLGDVESRVGVLEGQVSTLETELADAKGANCVAADVRGDTYRPSYCDARCDCLGVYVDQVSSCTVATAGGTTTYRMDRTNPVSVSCYDPGGGQPSLCIDYQACADSSDCTAPYDTCQLSLNVCISGDACTVASDCPNATPITVTDYWTITQTGTVDSDTAGCTQAEIPDPVVFTTNHKDSVECIAQAEAQLGQACTPAP